MPADAAEQTRLGEIAAFEAYLVEASLAVGDADLRCADLRRAALLEALPAPDALPADPRTVRDLVRAVMRAVLGPAESARLDLRLAALDGDSASADPAPDAAPGDPATDAAPGDSAADSAGGPTADGGAS
jgi:hypothetical protein